MKVDKKIIEKIKNEGVGVLPTDTVYGLVGLASSKKAVERIYKLKKRDKTKPLIILISSPKDLALVGIQLSDVGHQILNKPRGFKEILFGNNNFNVINRQSFDVERRTIEKFWPGKVSIALPCVNLKIKHLVDRNGTIGFRMPKPRWLRKLLVRTGPLVAPSANLEGEQPAETIEQAKVYFGGRVDFYVDGGKLAGEPSTLIKIENNKVIVIRQGAVKI